MNRTKAVLARLGIRNFKPTLRKAAERLATVHTLEGMLLPPNTFAELQRDTARLSFVISQIREIEKARQKRLEQQPATRPTPRWRLARIVGVGVGTADMLVHEVLSRPMRDRAHALFREGASFRPYQDLRAGVRQFQNGARHFGSRLANI